MTTGQRRLEAGASTISFIKGGAIVKTNLRNKLRAYLQSVQSPTRTKHSWARHLDSWPAFTVAGSASLAMVSSAGAGFIYSGIQNKTLSAGPSQNIRTNINIGTGAGFRLNALQSHFFATTSQVALFGNSSNQGMTDSAGNLLALASGAVISAGGRFGGGGNAFYYGNWFGPQTRGQFTPSNTAFAGVKMKDPLGTHYGWIRLHVNSTTSITAIDWAYNDVAGESIKAGQMPSTVPEPASITMALLGAGSAGVLAWRRRRKQEDVAA